MIAHQPELLSLRGALYVDVLVAVILMVSALAFTLGGRSWPLKVIALGVLGVFVYALDGQIKAVRLGIEFDRTSWIGLVSFTAINVGLVAAIGLAMWSRVLNRK